MARQLAYLDVFEERAKQWGFSVGFQSGPERAWLPELWDTKINRVFASEYITEQSMMMLGMGMLWPYLLNRFNQLIALAIFERAVWNKYHKMSWELDQKGIEIEL